AWTRLPLLCLVAIFCLLLSGCSKSSSSTPATTTTTTATPGALATIKITATPLAIATNATDQFSASGADSNGTAISSLTVTFTGTYTTGTDNRGVISITNSLGTFGKFAFVAGSLSGGVPTAGRMIEFDDSSPGTPPQGTSGERAAGVFYQQNTSAFVLSSVTGPYALQFFGQQLSAG